MSSTKNNPPPQQIPGLHDPQTDSFQKFGKDPRLSKSVDKQRPPASTNALQDELAARLKAITDRQDFFNELRIFKKEKLAAIAKLEDDPFTNRTAILTQITQVAESLIKNAFADTERQMRAAFGLPTYKNAFLQTEPADLALIGMGTLGAGILNYASDLDVLFLYSHLGESHGKTTLSNQEYFARFAQKWTHLLAVMTEHGKCYEIDFELRPSGHSGMLVSSFDHFLTHQMNQAQDWERMALLRARPLAGQTAFLQTIAAHVSQILLGQPVTASFYRNMKTIRDRVIAEKKPENAKGLHLKWASGLLMDVDFILLGLQLKNQPIHPDLRTTQPFALVHTLKTHSLIEKNELALLEEAQIFYHTLISKLHLQKKRSENFWVWDSPETQEIAAALGLSLKTIQEKIVFLRGVVQDLYKRYYESP